MKKIVADASALIQFFSGNDKVREEIEKSEKKYVNAVNLVEFLYTYTKIMGKQSALSRYAVIRKNFEIIGCDFEDILFNVSELKIKYNLSLGDAFLLATSIFLKAPAITTDKALEKVKEAKVIIIEK